ncbi:MAG: hypothetical protein IH606_20280 [Burkholderiales bacterium]|nr:hypothetical protein [Burkholderiales bacterium]
MNAQVDKFLQLSPLAGGIAAALVSGIAIAALAILARGALGDFVPEAIAAPPAVAATAGSAYLCAECGVIEAMREVGVPDARAGIDAPGGKAGRRGGAEAAPLRNYEITIRLRNGTMRVIRDASPANWRHGEPVTVIAGMD